MLRSKDAAHGAADADLEDPGLANEVALLPLDF